MLIGAIAMIFIGCAIAGLTAIKIVAWARDLPNRIVVDIDGDSVATAFGAAVVESYHGALRDGDSALQLQVQVSRCRGGVFGVSIVAIRCGV